MLTVNLTEDAGRAAYLAGYQAAENRPVITALLCPGGVW